METSPQRFTYNGKTYLIVHKGGELVSAARYRKGRKAFDDPFLKLLTRKKTNLYRLEPIGNYD